MTHDIITIRFDGGTEIDFYELGYVNYKNERYALLQPAEHINGIGDDEVIIYRVDNDGTYHPEKNNRVIDNVIKIYNSQIKGKKYKKSTGFDKVVGATKAVAKTTAWIIKLIIWGAITLLGAFLTLGGIAMGSNGEIIVLIIMGALGVAAFVWGLKHVISLFKNRY